MLNSDRPSRGRGRGRGRGSNDRDIDVRVNMHRGNNLDPPSSNGVGRGRGRGRGRGKDINVPAWMNDDTLKRQSQEQQQQQQREKPKEKNTVTKRSPREIGSGIKVNKNEPEIDVVDAEEIELKRQRQIEEEEELKKLAAQFGDADDDDDSFETEEEKEARLARERREKRKMRLKEIDGQEQVPFPAKKQKVEPEESVDLPRNPNGIIESEKEDETDLTPMIITNATDDDTNVALNVKKDDNDGNDSFDMFSSSVSPTTKSEKVVGATGTGVDDAEGYYRATMSEIINFSSEPSSPSFRVQGIIGKGVFSTVLKCTLVTTNESQSKDVVAIKLIRSNEIMAKAAQKEVRILRLLSSKKKRKNGSASQEHYIVQMFELDDFDQDANTKRHQQHQQYSHLLEYQNHTALLFEHLPFNLRETLNRFGKGVGINLSAVKSYAKQLLSALQHLASHRVVHADIKLDNILVSANFGLIKLCDFGSAFFETDSDNDPTPYLVSRYYRAPEIVLGLQYDKAIDLWSVAVSLAELFTGSVLYPGRNNNDMLKHYMDSIGPFSNKMIRRHVASFSNLGLQPHFETVAGGGSNFNFRRQEIDKVTDRPVIRMVNASCAAVPNRPIGQVLLRSRSASDSRGDVLCFVLFLSRCLALDPVKRISLDDALADNFFTKKKAAGHPANEG